MDAFVNHIRLNYGDAEISLFNIGVTETDSEQPIWHNHCYYELHFLTQGAYTCSLEDRQIHVGANELLILPPQVYHWSQKDIPTQAGHYVISLSLEKSQGQESLYAIFEQALLDAALSPVSFSGISREQLDLFSNQQLYQTVLGMCCLKNAGAQFLYRLFQRLLPMDSMLTRSDTDTDILIDNLVHRPDITLDEIAEAANYSKRHVSRLIRQRYGCTLSQLRKQKSE